MKQKLFYLLPILVLTGCGQVSYKNTSLSPEERADLLVKELTLEEKVQLMMDGSRPVERLGIKPYNWWNEALHGVARAGLAPKRYMMYSLPCLMRPVPRILIIHLKAAVSVIRD